MLVRLKALRMWFRSHPWLGAIPIAAVFAAIVAHVSAHHEPWRDEVVPLSIVRQAHSLRELFTLRRYEGQPMLWYLCLRYTYVVLQSTVALKVVSIVVAVAAVVIFLARAPLPLWMKLLFTFSIPCSGRTMRRCRRRQWPGAPGPRPCRR